MTPAGGSVDDLSLGETVLCGGVSGLAHSLLLYPVDLLKTRIQTEPSHYRRLSFAQVVRMHYHECGLRGFYRGFGLVAVFSFPSSALAFTTYQSVAHALTPRPRRHHGDL
ncbi:Mitochondrial carrier protein [Novymonas esmeraldas]|uniref:Mitochondrial carrier protein n=1 Tax=Novymonas esmeraldas TaxID=1808958 RepID=A0AAW0F306_9TRYP